MLRRDEDSDDSKESFDPKKQAVLPQLRPRPKEMLPEEARWLENPVQLPKAWGSPSQRVRIHTRVDDFGNTYW